MNNVKNCLKVLAVFAVFAVIVVISLVVVTAINGCLKDENKKEPEKVYVYEVYRRNPDGTQTKWVTPNKPNAHGSHVSWERYEGEQMQITDTITVVPVPVSEDKERE